MGQSSEGLRSERAGGEQRRSEPSGLCCFSLLLRLERERARAEGQTECDWHSVAGWKASSTRRESWGYGSRYRKAGGGRRGEKRNKSNEAANRWTQSRTRSVAANMSFTFRYQGCHELKTGLKAACPALEGASCTLLLSSSLRNDWKATKRKAPQPLELDTKLSRKLDRGKGTHFQNPSV